MTTEGVTVEQSRRPTDREELMTGLEGGIWRVLNPLRTGRELPARRIKVDTVSGIDLMCH